MPMDTSQAFRDNFLQDQSAKIPLTLLEITHDTFATPLRFVCNTQAVRKKPFKTNQLVTQVSSAHAAGISYLEVDSNSGFEDSMVVDLYRDNPIGDAIEIETVTLASSNAIQSTDRLNLSAATTSAVPNNSALGPTAAQNATTINVIDSSGFEVGDLVMITNSHDGAIHDSTIASKTSNSVTLSTALPSSLSGGKLKAGSPVEKYVQFLPFPFEVTFPPQEPNGVPTAMLSVDNVDRTIANTLRSLTSSPLVTLSIVLSDTPDVVEVQTPQMRWASTQVTALKITGQLTGSPTLDISYPMEDFSPSVAPGLFFD